MLLTLICIGSYIIRNYRSSIYNWKLKRSANLNSIVPHHNIQNDNNNCHNRNKIKMSLTERFEAAVKVIQSLPKDGPYQPSNSTKLRFYGLYKQATEGQCNQPQPSRFSIINRAKWDAWNKVGELEKDDAKAEYIEELKKIVETMPFTGDAQEFLEAINPFYEFVNMEGSEMTHVKKNLDEWTSSASASSDQSGSESNSSSLSSSPTRRIEEEAVKLNGINGYGHTNGHHVHISHDKIIKTNGHIVYFEEDKETAYASGSGSIGAENHKFIAPGAPKHRPSLSLGSESNITNGHGLNGSNEHNGSGSGSSGSSDEILKVDVDEVEDTNTISKIPLESRLSVDTVNSSSSEKYYSGDSDPEPDEVDFDSTSTPSTLVGGESSVSNLYPESLYGLNGISSFHGQFPNAIAPRRTSEPKITFIAKNKHNANPELSQNIICQQPLQTTTDSILRSTVDRLNRDVDHILARLRILEAAYASNVTERSNNSNQVSRRTFGPFRDISFNTLTLILTWPFVAYFIIRLVNLWVMSRRRR